MQNLNLDKNNLKKFGITMGLVFLVITLFILIRHRHGVLIISLISAVFFTLAFVAPLLLKSLYIFWMKFAFILSWINTRLILVIIFYLIFVPIGIGMKLFGIDLLDRKIEKSKESYWKKREKKAFSPVDYEKLF
ncbi:MAG: sxtJ [Candidatus Omnitrophica bacterium]|nr:sxtJ [Candidatus Omnitrophota bacterium]